MPVCRWSLLRVRNVSLRGCKENQNTHFVFNNLFQKQRHLGTSVKKYRTARRAKDDNTAHALYVLDN